MTVRRDLPVTLLTIVLAAFHPSSAVGQSDETCVAYMEADAAYEPARRKFESALSAADKASASFTEALNALHHAEAAYDVAVKNAADPHHKNLPELTDYERAKRNLDISRSEWAVAVARSEHAVASAAWRKAWDDLVAVTASTAPARKKRAWAYTGAYDGPVSDVDSVMEKLIAAQRQRCQERLEHQSE